jgi:murein DD-endopeptidase MepM/ murein hydrolase activator NlpD
VAGGWDAPEGTPIVAANAGTVQRVARSPRGWSIVVDHGPVLTFYQHLETTAVRQGERVTAGQRLGTMGADPLDAQHVRHLHFEVWQRVGADVAHLDPQPLMAPWKVIQWTQ